MLSYMYIYNYIDTNNYCEVYFIISRNNLFYCVCIIEYITQSYTQFIDVFQLMENDKSFTLNFKLYHGPYLWIYFKSGGLLEVDLVQMEI